MQMGGDSPLTNPNAQQFIDKMSVNGFDRQQLQEILSQSKSIGLRPASDGQTSADHSAAFADQICPVALPQTI